MENKMIYLIVNDCCQCVKHGCQWIKHGCQWIKHSGYTRYGRWREEKKPRSRVVRWMSRVVSESALSRIVVGAWNSHSFSFFLVPHSFVNDRQTMSARETGSLSTTSAHTYGHTAIVYKSNGRYSNAQTHTRRSKEGGISCLFLQWNHNRWQRLACSCLQRQRHYGWTHSDNRAYWSRHYAYLQRTYGWYPPPIEINGYWSMHIERRLCQCWWRWCRDPLSQQYQCLW